MPDLMVLHGEWDSGKTTTCLRAARYFRYDGIKTACLTFEKGINDVGLYWAEHNHHYCLPLEVAKGRSVLEKWLPVGYDLYILEGKNPGAGIMSNLFYSIYPPADQNICIPQYLSRDGNRFGCQPVITMCHPSRVPLEYPATDVFETIFSPEQIRTIPVEPSMILPRLYGKVLSAGYFPSEIWDMYPDHRWVREDSDEFWDQYESRRPDLIVLGWMGSPHEWHDVVQVDTPILCFDPRIWQENLTPFDSITPDDDILTQTVQIIRTDPVGSAFPDTGYLKKYNNPYWTQMFFQELPIISRQKNMTLINGWVHPLYLYQDGVISDIQTGQKDDTDCSSQLQHISPTRRRR
jgi:hypothetical protein